MKRHIVIALVLITSVVAFAQSDAGTLSIQPKVGINIAYYGESQASMGNIGTSPRIGLAAGVELAYQVREKIGLSAGVIYSQQGEKTETPTNWYSSVRMTALGVTNIVHDSGDDMTWNRGAQITIGYKFNL